MHFRKDANSRGSKTAQLHKDNAVSYTVKQHFIIEYHINIYLNSFTIPHLKALEEKGPLSVALKIPRAPTLNFKFLGPPQVSKSLSGCEHL